MLPEICLTVHTRMRIGIDYTSAVRQSAGIGRYTRSLVRALARLDSDNHYALLVPSDGRELAETQSAPHPMEGPGNFRTVRAPLTERALAVMWQRLRIPLPVEVFTGRIDICYSPDFVLPPTRAKKRILTVHDLSFKRVPETAVPNLKWYLDEAVPRAVKRADLILADSNATRTDLIELFQTPPERVETLYSGVDDYFCPVTDKALLAGVLARHGLAKPFILSVGTIEPRKNLVRLIEAFSRLGRQGEFDLVIVGGRGWMSEEIFSAPARFGVAPAVRFLGYVPESDLPALYSLASLFVYASLYEGFGLPVLEAMACGAPVITSDNSSMPEVAGEAAVLVDPRSVEGIQNSIARLLEDGNARSELGRRGRERAARFTWDASARRLLTAFES